MDNAQHTLAELQALWKKQLEDAEAQLERARNDVKKFEAEIQSEDVRTPDVHYAYQHALRAENLALSKYARFLVIFNDLTTHGIASGEEPKSKCG